MAGAKARRRSEPNASVEAAGRLWSGWVIRPDGRVDDGADHAETHGPLFL